MKLLLKDFQAEAVDRLAAQVRRARHEASTGELQAVSLAAPTGSGKTVMAAALLERLLIGDDLEPPNANATFLWVTDQPELNEQTRRKILAASSVLDEGKLISVDPSFDSERLDPGRVYFLNTQKLAKTSLLVRGGDRRAFTLWETVSNTATSAPGDFYLIVDEAHRGMAEDPKARDEANAIIQKFIKGSPSELGPVPIVIGISATPDRFLRVIEGTPRTHRPVNVPVAAVRDSGLLKDVIRVYHPTKEQPSDVTMLRAAARSVRDYETRWIDYCRTQGEPEVRAVLVVQVQDGTATQLTRTDLSEALDALEDELGAFDPTAYAHAFQEGGAIKVGEREVRYLAPADIAADDDVRVVLFKTRLNTGWDCPRAEVMMSFRAASDATLIAQLIGRLVRTPLARRIDSDEVLNSVALFLPHYDSAGVARVVERLTEGDPENLPPIDVQSGNELVVARRNPDLLECFDAMRDVPTYVVPRVAAGTQVHRLMKLARALARDEIHLDAPEDATELLLDVLMDMFKVRSTEDRFKEIVEASGRVRVRAVDLRPSGETSAEALLDLELSQENIADLFTAAGRRLGEGLHTAYWRKRVQRDSGAKIRAKLEIFALAMDPQIRERLELEARQRVQVWLSQWSSSIADLPDARRQAYREVRALAAEPEQAAIELPNEIVGRIAASRWPRHLYITDDGLFPLGLGSWERRVIEQELEAEPVVGWLRNSVRKAWSLCIPYRKAGAWAGFYPDFLVFRRHANVIKVDVIEPHSVHLEDAPAKAAAFAQFAARHADRFGRLLLALVAEDQVRKLDLADEATRHRVAGVSTAEHLVDLFKHAGTDSR